MASGMQDEELREILLSPCLHDSFCVALPFVGASPVVERACNPLAGLLLERESRRRPSSVSSPIPVCGCGEGAELGLLCLSPAPY
eukprot:m51a1_g4318 hypothetical protein (85) ;mRNA; r:55043-55297